MKIKPFPQNIGSYKTIVYFVNMMLNFASALKSLK